jgi:hypothetical protein
LKVEQEDGRGVEVEVERKVEEEVRRSKKRGLEDDDTCCEVDTEGALNVETGRRPVRTQGDMSSS